MGISQAPAPRRVYFYRLCRGTRGCEGRAAIRRGAAPLPRSSRTMPRTAAPLPCASGTRRLRLLGDPVQPGWVRGIPPQGNTAPQSLRPTRASLQPAKSWDEEDLTGIGTCPRTLSMRVCHPPIHPQSFLPDCLGKEQPGKEQIPKTRLFFSSYKWLRDSSWEQDHQSRDAQLLDPQDFSYTFSPFCYWFHNTPASLFHPPLSLPGWGFAVQPAQRWQGFPAPDV